MKRFLALLIACLALALVGAGCGGDDDDDSGNGGGSAETTQEQQSDTGGSGGTGAGTEVTMKDIKFNPANVTVKPGDTVTWSNADSVDHDVTGDAFKSGSPGGLANGDTYEHTFKKAGSFDYVCTVHPGMEGTVTVK